MSLPSTARLALAGVAGAVLLAPADAQAIQNVRGSVLDSGTRRPVEAALVEAADSLGEPISAALTNPDGSFELLVGTQVDPILLKVSALGYAAAPAHLVRTRGDVIVLDVALEPEGVELEGLSVTVTHQARFLVNAGFYARAEAGKGRHLGPDDLEGIVAGRTADFLRRVTGMTVGRNGEPAFRRGGIAGHDCLPAVWINGLIIRRGEERIPFEHIAPLPQAIAAMEMYPGGASTPAQWRDQTSSCGVIVIWTKH